MTPDVAALTVLAVAALVVSGPVYLVSVWLADHVLGWFQAWRNADVLPALCLCPDWCHHGPQVCELPQAAVDDRFKALVKVA